MATFNSSRERLRTDAYEQHSGRLNGKKIGRARFDHFPLMRLPTEIRLQILKRLLWQKETLMKDSVEREAELDGDVIFKPNQNFSFCTAILRICRQLREEGEQVLYNNTFGCHLFWEEDWTGRGLVDAEDTGDRRAAIEKPGYSSALLEEFADMRLRSPLRGYVDYDRDHVWGYWKKVRKIHLMVHVSESGSLLELRRSFRDFVKRSPDLPRLSHLTIDMRFADHNAAAESSIVFIHGDSEGTTISRQQFQDLAVGPLILMRGLESVDLRGISPDVAADLANTMTQKELSVENMPFMFDAILGYVIQHMHEESHCGLCSWAYKVARIADEAVDMEDIESFLNARTAILSCVKKHQTTDHESFFKHDLRPTTLPTTNHSDSQKSDYERVFSINTNSMLEARKARERQNPALRILREMWALEQRRPTYFDWMELD